MTPRVCNANIRTRDHELRGYFLSITPSIASAPSFSLSPSLPLVSLPFRRCKLIVFRYCIDTGDDDNNNDDDDDESNVREFREIYGYRYAKRVNAG